MKNPKEQALQRYLAPLVLVKEWSLVENGHDLLAQLVTVASMARAQGGNVQDALLGDPDLVRVIEQHPHLARTVTTDLPVVHDLLDAFDLYEAAAMAEPIEPKRPNDD